MNRIGKFMGRSRHIAGVVTALVVLGAVAAPPAHAAGVPHFTPSRIPDGFAISLIDESSGNNGNTGEFISLIENNERTGGTYTYALPISASEWKDAVKDFKKQKLKAIKVKNKVGYATDGGSSRRVYWFEVDRAFISEGLNISLATHKAIASNIFATKAGRTTFAVKAVPAGFKNIYTGFEGALVGARSVQLFEKDPYGEGSQFQVRITSVGPSYLDVFYLSPLVGRGTRLEQTTVRGKTGWTYDGGYSGFYLWEEQPGLMIEVTGSGTLTDAQIKDVAESLVPIDDTAWVALEKQAAEYQKGLENYRPGEAQGALVGAGMIDNEPWTATASSNANCLFFKIGDRVTESCITKSNALGWSSVTVSGKTIAVGVTAANIATVVAKSAGAEVGRTAVGPVSKQPLVRLFVMTIPAGAGVTVAGLDAAGTEVQTGVAAKA